MNTYCLLFVTRKLCEISLLLSSDHIHVVLGETMMHQEVFIGCIRVKAELIDNVRSDEFARLAETNFNWCALSNEYSSVCYYR
jgi:hypothetical protein